MWLNGLAHVNMSDTTVNLGLGHRNMHTVLNLAAGQATPGEPMMRVSFVLWSKAGAEVPGLVDQYWEMSHEGSEVEVELANALHTATQAALTDPAPAQMRRRILGSECPSWLAVGSLVEARFGVSKCGHAACPGWWLGIVHALHQDGTCDVLFDDGDFESHLPPYCVRLRGGKEPHLLRGEGLQTTNARHTHILQLRLRGGGGARCKKKAR